MKPKKRVFCAASKRTKMRFETKEEAERFIYYNGQQVNSYLRVYYCESCCGYHITHGKERENYVDYSKLEIGEKSIVQKAIEKKENSVIRKPIEHKQPLQILGHIELETEEEKKEKKRCKRKSKVNHFLANTTTEIFTMTKKQRNRYYRENHIDDNFARAFVKIWIKTNSEKLEETLQNFINRYIDSGALS